MNQDVFMEKMADLLDCENEITMNSVLNDIEEWDSLSIVSFLAMANTYNKRKIEPAKIREAVTVRDLYDLMNTENV